MTYKTIIYKDNEGEIEVHKWYLEEKLFKEFYRLFESIYKKENLSWSSFYDKLEEKSGVEIIIK